MGKLSEQVMDVIERADNDCGLSLIYMSRDDWQTIRAELHRLAEIADGVDPLVIRLGEVTTQLEKMRAIVAACASEAGAIVSPTCSEQFLSDVPLEIRAVCRKAESRLEVANAKVEQLRMIANVNGDWNLKYGAMKDRAAAANALLRECRNNLYDCAKNGLINRLDNHLQGAGDE